MGPPHHNTRPEDQRDWGGTTSLDPSMGGKWSQATEEPDSFKIHILGLVGLLNE